MQAAKAGGNWRHFNNLLEKRLVSVQFVIRYFKNKVFIRMSKKYCSLKQFFPRAYSLYMLFPATPTSVTMPCSHARIWNSLPFRECLLKCSFKSGVRLSSGEQPEIFQLKIRQQGFSYCRALSASLKEAILWIQQQDSS